MKRLYYADHHGEWIAVPVVRMTEKTVSVQFYGEVIRLKKPDLLTEGHVWSGTASELFYIEPVRHIDEVWHQDADGVWHHDAEATDAGRVARKEELERDPVHLNEQLARVTAEFGDIATGRIITSPIGIERLEKERQRLLALLEQAELPDWLKVKP